MNRNINMFGKTIPVWFLIATIVGAGSLAIATQGGAVHQEDAPDIQHSSDVKIHLQDVDGKVITNVPISASRAFSPLPVAWNTDAEAKGESTDGPVAVGSNIQTKQKLVINAVFDTSEDGSVSMVLDNNSEDRQIFLIKANAPSHVMLDLENGDGDFDEDGAAAGINIGGDALCDEGASNIVTIHGLTGHNEWLASIPGGTASNHCADMTLEISVTDAGFYPIVVELLRVG